MLCANVIRENYVGKIYTYLSCKLEAARPVVTNSSEKPHESFKNFLSSIHRCRFLFLISSVDSKKWPRAMWNACERKWGRSRRGHSNIIKLCNFLREGKSFSFFKTNIRNYFSARPLHERYTFLTGRISWYFPMMLLLWFQIMQRCSRQWQFLMRFFFKDFLKFPGYCGLLTSFTYFHIFLTNKSQVRKSSSIIKFMRNFCVYNFSRQTLWVRKFSWVCKYWWDV